MEGGEGKERKGKERKGKERKGKEREGKEREGRGNNNSRDKYSTSFFKIVDGVLVFINISLDWMVLENDAITNYVLFEI